jgi:histone H3/H4
MPSTKTRKIFPNPQIKRFINNQIEDCPKISKKVAPQMRKAMTARVKQLARDALVFQKYDLKAKGTLMHRHITQAKSIN